MPRTALAEKLADEGLPLKNYRGADTVEVFSDPRDEFEAVRSSAGVYDLGWRSKLVLTGNDRVRWLNGMITNNVRDLPVNHGVYSFVLNAQGRILGDLYAYNRGEYLLVDTDRSQLEPMRELFDKFIIMDDVELTKIEDKLTGIGLAGPGANEILADITREHGQFATGLEPLQVFDTTWAINFGYSIVRSDFPLVPAYELWLAPEHVGTVWNRLTISGATPVGFEALELLRVAAGVPRYGIDIRDRDLPQETEQQRALNFNKGCYVGQEIVERIHSRGAVHRMFTGFKIAHRQLPPPGSKIQAAGKEVGEITSVATVPCDGGQGSIALGYIRREAGNPGSTVEIDGVPAVVTAPPLVDVNVPTTQKS
ncbi:MAG TPA: glycine cleavage T C-terminal barrel domain-containing protein [Terriglobales bacterium]|nr:glycine cleavage T C-terminal barrel domain-containing protein [Terriglobales bacterium]